MPFQQSFVLKSHTVEFSTDLVSNLHIKWNYTVQPLIINILYLSIFFNMPSIFLSKHNCAGYNAELQMRRTKMLCHSNKMLKSSSFLIASSILLCYTYLSSLLLSNCFFHLLLAEYSVISPGDKHEAGDCRSFLQNCYIIR